MNYYAIHVLTKGEDEFQRRLRPRLERGRILVPKRVLSIRKGGKVHRQSSPVFPGYVFLEHEDILADADAYWCTRRTPGFIRFLKTNVEPIPLSERDRHLILHFMSFGEYADTSKVSFDEDDRIVVLEGPLKGLEGRIVKVDRRKGRAKVALDLCETGFLIDLGFSVVERIKSGGDPSHEESRA